MTSRSMETRPRICTSSYILGTWGDVVCFKYEWKVKGEWILKLGPHDEWYVFVMCDASWFAHHVYEEICVIWVDVSFVYSLQLVHQVGNKLTHQSKRIKNICDSLSHPDDYL